MLIISTDPAHNLSDAFRQKFNRHPSLINGFNNLYAMVRGARPSALRAGCPRTCAQRVPAPCPACAPPAQEVDPNAPDSELEGLGEEGSFFADLAGSIPGIDEAVSFAEVMKQVQSMDYDCIVFDTAPTGHTLRLLQFPSTLQKALDKLTGLKGSFGGILQQAMSLFGGSAPGEDDLMGKFEQMKDIVTKVRRGGCLSLAPCPRLQLRDRHRSSSSPGLHTPVLMQPAAPAGTRAGQQSVPGPQLDDVRVCLHPRVPLPLRDGAPGPGAGQVRD